MLETLVGCEGNKFIAVILWSIVGDELGRDAVFSKQLLQCRDD